MRVCEGLRWFGRITRREHEVTEEIGDKGGEELINEQEASSENDVGKKRKADYLLKRGLGFFFCGASFNKL